LFCLVLAIVLRPFNIHQRLLEGITITSLTTSIIVASFWIGTRAISHKIINKYRSRLFYSFLSILCVLSTILFGELILNIIDIDPARFVSESLAPVIFTGLVWGFWSTFLFSLDPLY